MAEKSTFSSIKKGIKSALSLKDFFQTMKGFWGVFSWALICDGLSIIPWVGLIFAFLGYASIWLTLEIKGVSASPIGSSKRAAATAAEWIAGAFGFGIVPGISVWTYFAISEHKAELVESQQKEQATAAKIAEKGSKVAGRIEPVKSRHKTSAYMKDAA